jgi:WD40 repeat protein
VTVWDIAAHKEVGRFGGGEGMKVRFFGQSIRFSDDGKTIAVTLANDAIELWEVASGKLVRTISGYEAERGNRVAVRVVLGAGGRMTRTDLAFSADGKTVAASLGNATVRQFDTGTGNEVAPTPGHLSGVIAVGSDGRNVVTASKESVRVWDAVGGELRHWSLSPPAVAAAVSPDAKCVATSPGNGVVRVWDAATGEKVREIDTKRGDVAGIAFSPDGKLIATKAELTAAVNLWDAATGNHLRTVGQDGESGFSGGRVMIESGGVQTPAVVFSPDGRLVAAAGDKKQVCVWDVATGTLVREFPVPARQTVAAVAFSGNGHALATLANTGGVTVYEVATGEKRCEFTPPTGATDPFGMLTGSGAMNINAFTRGNANAGGLGFTPDGRFVLSAVGSPVIRVWDTLTGQEATQLKGHQGGVSHLRLSRDGRSLVSGSVDTTALVWDLGPLPRVELAREMPLAATDLDTLWADLAKPDPAAAFTATRKLLTARTQAAGLLKERLHPVPAADDAKIAQLVADLGGTFDARRKAAAELERLGELAVPHLRKALEGDPALDLKQRVEGLLQKTAVRRVQGDQLRELRAVELLELAGTPEAKQVLESLAKGAAGARLTREAEAALARLAAAK